MSQTQSPIASTTPEALRAAIAEAVQVDAQQLQSAVGSIQVAISEQLQVTDPQIQSLYDRDGRTLTLLADRIPAGQEAQQFAAALVNHVGVSVAAEMLGEEAVRNTPGLPSFSCVAISADWLPKGESVEAYSNGQLWNGWAMPYFSIDGVRRLLELMPELKFDSDRDAVVMTAGDGQSEDEVFGGASIVAEGRLIKTYAIGAGYWCWEQLEAPISDAQVKFAALVANEAGAGVGSNVQVSAMASARKEPHGQISLSELSNAGNSPLEVLVDIARTIGARGFLSGGDSRDDWRLMCEWADEFQSDFNSRPDAAETYFEDVDAFAEKKASQAGWTAGISHAKNRNETGNSHGPSM